MAAANKTIVLITGANTGIGLESVRALVKSAKTARPYHILLGSRNIQKGEDAAALVYKENPDTKSSIEPVQIDITDDGSVEKLSALIKDKYGRLDVLVNNAGQ